MVLRGKGVCPLSQNPAGIVAVVAAWAVTPETAVASVGAQLWSTAPHGASGWPASVSPCTSLSFSSLLVDLSSGFDSIRSITTLHSLIQLKSVFLFVCLFCAGRMLTDFEAAFKPRRAVPFLELFFTFLAGPLCPSELLAPVRACCRPTSEISADWIIP